MPQTLSPEIRTNVSPASNLSDPTPVDPIHILNMMESNFPDPAIDWVRRASWIGPVEIPWDRINDANIDSWAASHQPDAVNTFARRIRSKTDKVNPSICIQGHDGDKVDIIDGHHRALAHKKLGQPVLAYLGTVKGKKDIQAALETHAMQYHAGNDPNNKSAETPELSSHHAPIGHEGVWHSKEPPLQLPAYIQNIRNAMMRNGMGEQEAHAMAVAAVERWAKGDLKWGKRRKVTPEVQAASQRAVAEWEELRRNHP